jgi:hypothetical protein
MGVQVQVALSGWSAVLIHHLYAHTYGSIECWVVVRCLIDILVVQSRAESIHPSGLKGIVRACLRQSDAMEG